MGMNGRSARVMPASPMPDRQQFGALFQAAGVAGGDAVIGVEDCLGPSGDRVGILGDVEQWLPGVAEHFGKLLVGVGDVLAVAHDLLEGLLVHALEPALLVTAIRIAAAGARTG